MTLQMIELQILTRQMKNWHSREAVPQKRLQSGEKSISIPGMNVRIARQCRRFQQKFMEMSLTLAVCQNTGCGKQKNKGSSLA